LLVVGPQSTGLLTTRLMRRLGLGLLRGLALLRRLTDLFFRIRNEFGA
jgi:hypothetical protein